MNKSPLAQQHSANGAILGNVDGETVVLNYGDSGAEEEAARAAAGLIDLPQVHTMSLEGPDARRFANGMFTNNIRRLQAGEGNRSAMCDDRGRVQGLLDVYCTAPDRFEGVLEGVSASWFEKRYEMYIVFDDVEMTVSDSTPWVLSLQGPNAAAILSQAGLPTPAENGHHELSTDGIRVAKKDRSGLGGFDLLVPTDQMASIAERLVESGASWLGHTALEAIRVSNVRARWPIDGSDKTFVHELAINEEVCNFNKGCYLGQEVINRIDVKGQVTKRLSLITFKEEHTLVSGASVSLDEATVGSISSFSQADGHTVALAILRKSAWEVGTEVSIETPDGPVRGHVTK